MKIITPLAVLITAANFCAIGPALDKEYDNDRAKIIAHQLDNLDNQGDLNDEVIYYGSDKAKIAKRTNNSVKTNRH